MDFRLPALGEGIDSGTVTQVMVKPGDLVAPGQVLVVVETDKAAVDVPADSAGKVSQIHVKEGTKIRIGDVLLSITQAETAAAEPAPQKNAAPAVPAAVPAKKAEPAPTPARPLEPEREPAPTSAPVAAHAAVAMVKVNGTKTADIPAGPATRQLARKLGVSLTEVKGSGRGDRVTVEDVMAFVKSERERGKPGGGASFDGSIVDKFALPAFRYDPAKFGPVEVREVSTIRQTIAKNLTVGWRTMPMVTQHELADITELEEGRKRIVASLAAKSADPKKGPKITWTVLAIKACAAALKEFPHFNSSFDMNAGKLIVKKYYHIGIAVDTERGLVVPVIRDADKKGMLELAAEVAELAEKAKANKLPLDAMQGGTFTISNLGGIGGTAFTPIVNYPEVAILGLSRSSLQPVVKDGAIVPRLMMPLSLTYDHRVIDGADGCRFTVRLAQLFSDPLRLLLET